MDIETLSQHYGLLIGQSEAGALLASYAQPHHIQTTSMLPNQPPPPVVMAHPTTGTAVAVSGVQPPQQPQNLALATSALDAPVINMTSGGGGKNFYQCYFPDCSKTYTTAAGLRYHRKVVHNNAPMPMPQQHHLQIQKQVQESDGLPPSSSSSSLNGFGGPGPGRPPSSGMKKNTSIHSIHNPNNQQAAISSSSNATSSSIMANVKSQYTTSGVSHNRNEDSDSDDGGGGNSATTPHHPNLLTSSKPTGSLTAAATKILNNNKKNSRQQQQKQQQDPSSSSDHMMMDSMYGDAEGFLDPSMIDHFGGGGVSISGASTPSGSIDSLTGMHHQHLSGLPGLAPTQPQGPKEYNCPVEGCTNKYQTAAGLRYHTKAVHSNIPKESQGDLNKPACFVCPIEGCDKKYTTMAGLRYHRKVHMREDMMKATGN